MLYYLVFLGAAVNIFGAFSYIRNTLRGQTKPNRVTWLMWFVAPLIATVAALVDGVSWAVLPVFMAGFCPLLIFFASFVNRNAYWKLETFDYLCGLCSFLALALWGITREPVIAIVFAIASDGFAAVPTLVKSWNYPKTESSIAYSTGLFNALTSFAAVKAWVFSEYAFAVYLVIVNSLLLLAIYGHKIFRKEFSVKEEDRF